MSSVNWTESQKNAIEARGGSVLVSAAAGSGKTAVLVERVIQAVTDENNPVSLDRMLIVTFTRAASAEMRARIEKAINDRLERDPLNTHLLNQRRLLYSARISTIDSFCIDFVRQYFFELDIQSDFRIADNGELDILVNTALDNTLEFFYKQNDKSFLNLVSSVCTYRNDDNLRNHIKNTYYFLNSIPFAEKWYDSTLGLYSDKTLFETTPYYDYAMKYARDSLSYCADINMNALKYVKQCETIPEQYAEKYETLLVADSRILIDMLNLLEKGSWDDVRDALSSIKFGTMPRVKKGECDEEKEIITAFRKQYKDEKDKLLKLFFQSYGEISTKTKESYPIVKAFVECVKKFSSELYSLKQEKNILDFSDVSRLMVRLLYDYNDGSPTLTRTAEEISSQFDAVMVDEFQDINEIQDYIFSAICSGRDNLFFVGDVKQCIYQFRQAKPEIFINYKNTYPLYSSDKNNYPSKIILDRNFRSSRGVTEAVNYVFKTLMSKDTGGIDYNDEEKLVCGTSYPKSDSPAMELMLISADDLNPEKNETELTLEATRVAEKIYSLIYEEKMQIKDGDTLRNIQYGDIAILIRSPKGLVRRAVTFVETLERYGIPTVSEEKNSFFDSNEIKVMLNILRVIDNPMQDIPVLSAALSSVFGFTTDDIAQIRSEYRSLPIYTAIKKSIDKYPVCREFVDFIDKMRTLAVTTTVDRLINIIIQTTGFESVTMATSNLSSKNLFLLRDYARGFSANGYKTLSSFVSYIDRIKENETELNAENSSNDETLNAVHIKSIHKSKGLEYPVCFISCTSTEFNLDDTTGDLITDADNGAGFRLRKEFVKYDSIQRKTLSMMLREKQIFEEIRVLYVAMTRAKQKIIITSVKKNPRDYLSKLEAKIPSYPITPYVITSVKSFSDWLFMCAIANPDCDIAGQNIEPDVYSALPNAEKWSFSLVEGGYMKLSNKKVKTKSRVKKTEIDEDFLSEFTRRIEFDYKNKPLETIPQKVSASELSHKDNKIFNKLLRKPEFSLETKSDGAERGTAFHTFMERCDLNSAVKNPFSEADNLLSKGFLTERQRELLDMDRVESFLKSSLVKRVINSNSFHREYTFTVEISARDYNPEIDTAFSDRKIIMQGAVDLIFIENNEAVIVDYKTDRVKDSQKLVDMYRKQVTLYKNAVEEIMKIPVKEVIIYSIHNNEPVKVL